MLQNNAFFILDVTTRDDKESIAESFDEKAADGDHDETTLHQAQRTLMASKSRLEAELSWFPDLAPKNVKKIAEKIDSGFKKSTVKFFKDELEHLDGVSKANLAAYVCMAKKGDMEFIESIIAAQSEISAEAARSNINANRNLAGFPDVNETLVSQQLEKLEQIWAQAAIQQISESDHPGDYMVKLLNNFSKNENQSSKHFLNSLMDRYETFIVPILRNHEDTINVIIDEIKEDEAADASDGIDILISKLELWDEYAQPSQLVYCSKGLDEPRSKKIYENIRDFYLWLANDMRQYQLSLKISKATKEIFAELPFVINKIDEDIGALEDSVVDAEMEEIIKPLFILVEKIFKDDRDFVKTLCEKGFSEISPGMAGEVFREFQKFCTNTAGTENFLMPWEMLRKISIYLNNESKNPEAAMKIFKKMQSMSPPGEISDQIDDDIYTIQLNILSRDFEIALEAKNISQVKFLLHKMIELGRVESEKTQWRTLLSQIESKERKWPWGLIFWIAAVLAIIVLNGCSGPSETSFSSLSKYQPSSASNANFKLEE